MTVAELIERLKALPPDLDVYLFAGFDGMTGSGPAVAVGVIEGALAICDESQADLLD